MTVKDYYAPPNIDPILDFAAKGKVRGKIDLTDAYFNIPVAPEDIYKTAMRTHRGLWEWVYMPQGLCNAPATFQRYMTTILQPYLGKICHVYLDDIIVSSPNIKEHEENMFNILTILHRHGLKVSEKKTVLIADEIEFLGHRISNRGIQPDPNKIDKIADWPRPRTVKHIQQFLGLVNYLARFAPTLSEQSSKLSQLTRKDILFEWNAEHEIAFNKLKAILRNTPILGTIDVHSKEPIWLVTDASETGIGSYIAQGPNWDTARPAAFYSRSFIPAEHNYDVFDKEALSVIAALKKFRRWLVGTQFTLCTDHKSLVYWREKEVKNLRQSRWKQLLADYDFEIQHVPGIVNQAADALSRYPYALLAENQIKAICNEISFQPTTSDQIEALKLAYKEDTVFNHILENPSEHPTFSVENGIIEFAHRIAIPNNRHIRTYLLNQYHDLQNHYGFDKTYAALYERFYWPDLTKDVQKYIESCHSCAANKATTKLQYGLHHALPVPIRRFCHLSIDFVGELTESNGYNSFIVITDRLTNYAKIIPNYTTDTAQDVAFHVFNNWYRHFGLPDSIVSDRDSRFRGDFWKALHKLLGVKISMSTAYHPETDGATERANKTIIENLRHHVNTTPNTWADYIVRVESSFNNFVSRSTGLSPNALVFGYEPRLLPDLTNKAIETPATAAELVKFVDKLKLSTKHARDQQIMAKTRQTIQANHAKLAPPIYKVNDLVYFNSKNLRQSKKAKGQSAKFFERYLGPYRITHVYHDTPNVRLALPLTYRMHNVVHVSLIKPYISNDESLFPNRKQIAPRDGSPNSVIEVLHHRRLPGGELLKYLVYFENNAEPQWVKEASIEAPNLIRKYWAQFYAKQDEEEQARQKRLQAHIDRAHQLKLRKAQKSQGKPIKTGTTLANQAHPQNISDGPTTEVTTTRDTTHYNLRQQRSLTER